MLFKIFKQDLKESFKTWIICALTLNILFILIYFASGTMKTRGAFLVEQFYTMFATIVPLIFVIGTANRLVVSQVDDGSLFMVMVAGYKRSQVSSGQAFFGGIPKNHSVSAEFDHQLRQQQGVFESESSGRHQEYGCKGQTRRVLDYRRV